MSWPVSLRWGRASVTLVTGACAASCPVRAVTTGPAASRCARARWASGATSSLASVSTTAPLAGWATAATNVSHSPSL